MEDKKLIKNRMLDNIDDKYDKSEGSFFFDGIVPVAIEIDGLNKEIESIKSNMDIFNKKGNDLDIFISQRSRIIRKEGTKARGLVTIGGNEGAKINKGIIVSSDTTDYRVLEEKIIGSSLKAQVEVECLEDGNIGNTPSNQINQFPVTISGLNSVDNTEAFTNGYNKEDDNSLRDRYLEFIRLPITSGNKNHYLFWAKEVVGVGQAKVIPLWNGDNTVKVIISDSNGNIASDNLVREVQGYIDPGIKGLGQGEAPIGAFCTVVSVKNKEIDISLDVELLKGAKLEDVEKSFKDKVELYFKEAASKIFIAQIECIIFNVPGVIDRKNVLLNKKAENIEFDIEEIPHLGEVVLNVIG